MSRTKRVNVSEETLAYPTIQAAARSAGLTRQTLAKHLDEIAHRKVGRRVIITKAALKRWLEGHDESEVA